MRGTGRGLQKANLREPVGCGNHRCFSLFKHIEHLIKHGEGLREHLPDGWFFEFIEQRDLTAFGKEPRIGTNDAEVAQTSFDFRFQTRLFAAHLLVVRNQLLESAAIIVLLIIYGVNPVQAKQFGEFASINRIILL